MQRRSPRFQSNLFVSIADTIRECKDIIQINYSEVKYSLSVLCRKRIHMCYLKIHERNANGHLRGEIKTEWRGKGRSKK